ncbi:Tn3 family transposase [Brevibacillus invocatus]|uniref:Tn3 family transposase n=3 Tax=Brevibacillus TaxID=55080 RepID=UPI0039A04DDB
MSAGEHGESYKDLLYVRRKFIHKDNLRNAISEVVNAIFRVRMQEIWGNTTSSCAFWYDFLARHMLSDCGVEQVYEDFCNNWENRCVKNVCDSSHRENACEIGPNCRLLPKMGCSGL